MAGKKHIIITGGAGFIGSALVWELNRAGLDNIVIVDALGRGGDWRNLNGLRFIDYIDKDDFSDDLQQGKFDLSLEAVFHLGACSSTTETDLRYLLKNNFEYSKLLARFCLGKSIRLIYASSAATYGDGRQSFDDSLDKLPLLRPLNPYGFSKQLFDFWAWRQGALEKIAGLKYFNVFGPNEYHKGEMRSMACKGFEQIRSTGRLRLFKSDRPEYRDGEQERDFLYVKDAVKMTAFFLFHPEIHGLFNIGGGSLHTWNELAECLFQAMGIPPCIEYVPMPMELKNRYQYHTKAEIGRIRSSGYSDPISPFSEAVTDYVHNYLEPGLYLGGAEGTAQAAEIRLQGSGFRRETRK